MTFKQFFIILRARWITVFSVFFAVVGLVLVLSLVLPKKYKAEASVMVDVNPDPVASVVYGALLNPAIMATQVDIITSDRVARRVIRNLKLDKNPDVIEQWHVEADGQGSVEDWLGGVFQKHLDVKPSRESNVITVSYSSGDPKGAAAIANAFVQAYLDTALELRVDPARKYSGFFGQQTKEAKDKLEAAQKALSTAQQETGITGSDERLDVETARLNELSSQLVAMQTLAAETSSREHYKGEGDTLSDTLTNPVVANLKVDLGRAEANLHELSSRLGANNPQVIQAQANIAELRSRIAAETRRVTGSVDVNARVNASRVAAMRDELDAQRQKVLELKAGRDRIAILEKELESAQRNYDSVSTRFSQVNLESQTQQANVVLLSPASPPLDPAFPKLLLNTLVGVFLGVLIAIGSALVRELVDRRVRNTRDLAESLAIPVLGVMPRPPKKRKGALASGMAQRVISGRLPAPGN
jgi:chain length determinant protein EpsF